MAKLSRFESIRRIKYLKMKILYADLDFLQEKAKLFQTEDQASSVPGRISWP